MPVRRPNFRFARGQTDTGMTSEGRLAGQSNLLATFRTSVASSASVRLFLGNFLFCAAKFRVISDATSAKFDELGLIIFYDHKFGAYCGHFSLPPTFFSIRSRPKNRRIKMKWEGGVRAETSTDFYAFRRPSHSWVAARVLLQSRL